MLSSVLRSDRAVSVNVQIMRAFVRMPEPVGFYPPEARPSEETSVHDSPSRCRRCPPR